MEKITALINELEATMDACEKWASGTYTKQTRQQGRRKLEREYSLTAAVLAMRAILPALNGETVNPAAEKAAQAIIAAAKWHEPGPGRGLPNL